MSFVCARLNGVRERCERRVYIVPQPAKARTASCAREQDRRGCREWRVGTRSGFGRPGRPGFLGGGVGVAALNRARGTRVLVSAAR